MLRLLCKLVVLALGVLAIVAASLWIAQTYFDGSSYIDAAGVMLGSFFLMAANFVFDRLWPKPRKGGFQ